MPRKKICEKQQLSVEAAVALVIETDPSCLTKKRDLREILKEVKGVISNPQLTIKNLKEALARWLREGWAVVSHYTLQITRSGREQIKKLALSAYPPFPA